MPKNSGSARAADAPGDGFELRHILRRADVAQGEGEKFLLRHNHIARPRRRSQRGGGASASS